ncbi:MAG: hypothetical protein IJ658_07055 [Kiritimatiellae bacterium]|nr:hypothetical protein [Kiritimatiellia bacterium]
MAMRETRRLMVSVATVVVMLFALSSRASLLSSMDGGAAGASIPGNIALRASSNERYEQWRARRAAGETPDGLPPDRVDWDKLSAAYARYDIRRQSVAKGKRLLASTSLPTAYDLRTYNRVTPVRDQGAYDTCWAFSVLGSFESRILAREQLTVDFSENNMVSMNGRLSQWGESGNVHQAMSYLLRWDGPGLETEDPYPNGSSRLNLKPCRRLTDYIMLPPRSSPTDNSRIKQAVMDYGAVRVSYYADNSKYLNAAKGNGAYYYPGGETVNHAVCIIGWDDTYSATNFKSGCQPPGDGAFIIKNSWGTSHGSNGYTYISYHDYRLARDEGAYVITGYLDANAENGEFLFQHDTFGRLTVVPFDKLSDILVANVFTAEEDCEVYAVGFYTEVPGLSYQACVMKDLPALKPSGQEFLGLTDGTVEFAGYHTVQLSSPVALSKGEILAVLVELEDKTGEDVDVALEVSEDDYPAVSAAGESFLYYNDDWVDFKNIVVKTSDGKTCEHKNCCVKALARRRGGSQSLDAPANVKASRTDEFVLGVSWDSVNGADGYNIYRSESASRPATPYRQGVTSPFSDYDALPGREYRYWVEATNSASRAVSDGVLGWRPPYLRVSLSQSFPGEGGTTNIYVSSTAVWSAEPDRDWIRITRAGVNELTYSVDQNPSGEYRSGHIVVTSPDDAGATYTSVAEITVFQHGYVPPDATNDDIGDAIWLGSVVSGETTGSNYGATIQPESPVYERTVMYSELGTNSVWWTWTAPEDGMVTFSLEGSSFWSEIVVATYNPSSTGIDSLFGPFKKIAQSDYTKPCNADVTSGTTYHIRVSGVLGTFGSIRLSWAFKATSELIGTWHVDAKRGSDSNDGLSWESPLKTISAAVEKADADRGGTIFVNDGVYAETVNAMFKHNLTIRSVNGAAKTAIDGKGNAAYSSCVLLADSSSLIGFTVRNGGGYNGGGAYGGFLHQCVLSNNVAKLRGGGAHGSVLSNCLVVNNSAPDGGGTYQCELTNCTVVCNSASATCGGTYSGHAYNSIVWGNTLTGVGTAINYLSTVFRYSCTSPAANGTGNINEDPCLVASGGTYVLDETSPCINAGSGEYATAIADVFGNMRIYGSAVDMGAAESPYLQRVIRKPECDVGFYTFDNYGWSYPMCLSSTNLAWMAYAPEYAFGRDSGLVLNCCAVNYSSKAATVEGMYLAVRNAGGEIVKEKTRTISSTISAGGGYLFDNINLGDWLAELQPGNYSLTVVLDPDDSLGDPDRSNNTASLWFAVEAADDEHDVGFYAFHNLGWERPVFVSSTNINAYAYEVYAPENTFRECSDMRLTFCAWNRDQQTNIVLQSAVVRIYDSSDNVVDAAEFVILRRIGPNGADFIRNIDMGRYIDGLAPGTYRLEVELDPNDRLKDPDRSNNKESVEFAIVSLLPSLDASASPSEVAAAIDGGGFADAARIKEAIGGDVNEYRAFEYWARGVEGGMSAVVKSSYAAPSYLLGTPVPLRNEPMVEIAGVGKNTWGGASVAGNVSISVRVKDGENVVMADVEKVGRMVEATCDLGDWTGAARLMPTISERSRDDGGTMHFTVVPGDGTAPKAFLRIRWPGKE